MKILPNIKESDGFQVYDIPEPELTKEELAVLTQFKQSRALLRQVDSVLKKQGVEQAIEALAFARALAPKRNEILAPFNRYAQMLQDWLKGLMLPVQRQFEKYGCHRAAACAQYDMLTRPVLHLAEKYINCQEALMEMSERQRLEIMDNEGVIYKDSDTYEACCRVKDDFTHSRARPFKPDCDYGGR